MENKFVELNQFANEREILRLRKFDEDYRELIEECLLIISTGLSLEPVDRPELLPGSLLFPEMLGHERIELLGSPNDDVQIAIMEYDWTYRSSRVSASGIDHYLAGWMELSVRYPYSCLFGVSGKQKMGTEFQSEQSFAADTFSISKYVHAYSQDPQGLNSILGKKNLKSFSGFPGMMIELNGNKCMFRISADTIDEENAKGMVELVKTIRGLLD